MPKKKLKKKNIIFKSVRAFYGGVFQKAKKFYSIRQAPEHIPFGPESAGSDCAAAPTANRQTSR